MEEYGKEYEKEYEKENEYISSRKTKTKTNKLGLGIPVVISNELSAFTRFNSKNNNNYNKTVDYDSTILELFEKMDSLEAIIYGKDYLYKKPELKRSTANIYHYNHDKLFNNDNVELDMLLKRIDKLEETINIQKKIDICRQRLEELEKKVHEVVEYKLYEEN